MVCTYAVAPWSVANARPPLIARIAPCSAQGDRVPLPHGVGFARRSNLLLPRLLVQADAYTGTLCTMVLLDVTLLSGYFFWRAWRVARLRDSGRLAALHAKLMSLGLFGTMSQLPQRCIMLLLMALRAMGDARSHGASNNVHGRDRAPVVSDAALFSISMISSQAIFLFFLDGPRSPWIRRRIRHSMEGGLVETTLWGASERDEYEMYAYDPLTPSARWKWRSRIVVYALARGAVTGWWARSPPLA